MTAGVSLCWALLRSRIAVVSDGVVSDSPETRVHARGELSKWLSGSSPLLPLHDYSGLVKSAVITISKKKKKV